MTNKTAKSTIVPKRPTVLFALFFIFSAIFCSKELVSVPVFAAIVLAVLAVVAAFRSKSAAISAFCILLSFFTLYPALFLSVGKYSTAMKLSDDQIIHSRAVVQDKTEMYDKTILYVILSDEKYSGVNAAVIYDTDFSPTIYDSIIIDGFVFDFDDLKQAEFYTKGFPSKETALSKGCTVGIYAKSITNLGRIPKNERSLLHNYYFYVNDNLKRCFENIGSVDTFSYASALLTGDRSYLSDSAVDAFRYSGLAAVLCISGLHVVISSAFLEFILKKLHITKALRAAILIAFLGYIMIITGGQGSVMRAAIMSIIFHVARTLNFHTDTLSTLATSFIVVALSNPFCIFDTSTQLSFLSMTGIVFSGIAINGNSGERHKIYYKLKNSLSVSLHAQTFAAVPVLGMFGGISLISPFSNLFVSLFFSPLMFGLVICAFLCFLPVPLLSVMALMPRYLIALLEICAKLFARIPFSYATFSLPELAVYCFWALFLVFLLSAAFLKNKAIIFTGFCCFLFTQAVTLSLYVLSFICN